MNDKDFIVCTVMLILIVSVLSICNMYTYTKQKEENIELKNKINYLEFKIDEVRRECKRDTDTCIDILSNGRWQ